METGATTQMTTATFTAFDRSWTLTDEHAASSYGNPVLVSDDGTPYGPWENAMKGTGEWANYSVAARAITDQCRSRLPGIQELRSKFMAVPYTGA